MERIFRLIDKAGGKAFIIDKHTGKDYVIMPLDEYEDLVEDFVDEEFIDLGDDFDNVGTDESPFAEPEEDQFYIEPLE